MAASEPIPAELFLAGYATAPTLTSATPGSSLRTGRPHPADVLVRYTREAAELAALGPGTFPA